MLPKAIEVSVPAVESKVQVMALPDPKVEVPISVVSRLTIKVPDPLSEVSIPFVPPEMVLVAPKAVVDEPLSPAKVMVELSSSVFEIDVPRVVTSVLPATESPVPAKLVKVLPPTVKDPTEADPVILALVETLNAPVETEPVTVTFCEKRPEPTTSSATVGAVVPIPNRFENDAVPAVKI